MKDTVKFFLYLGVVTVIFLIPLIAIYKGDIKKSIDQYNHACELQSDGYEVYMDGEKNNNVDIGKLKYQYYDIEIDDNKKEIIINHQN